ncbi:hypothetical protein AXW67_21850 [Bradyrhizobium neotropicale]|uniref:Autotransporter domain-containing protein n=1 Tax=Bradyrhizobium neotropicale TaxID=1497615 RepID=A0A176YXI8_9BRAD|nr:hypothetical protein AXW67_21850 [Bradyrhizobium neotropicale]
MGTLIMQTSSGSAAINVQSSNFASDFGYSDTLQLNSNTVITTAPGATFSFGSGTITGAGSLTLAGSGLVTLNTANSYTGGTILNGGNLVLAGAGTLGSTANNLTVNGGNLDLGNSTQTQSGDVTQTGGTIQKGTLNTTSYQMTGGTLASSATVSASTEFDAQAGTVNGVLAGAGALVKSTSGTVTLAGANSYTGGTTINAGTLAISGAGTLGNIANGLTITAGALDLGGTAQTQNGGLTLTGGTVQNGTLASAGLFDVRTGAVSAALAGAGAVMKGTAGTVTFSGANLYTGGTIINAGIFSLSGAGTLGDVANSLKVNGGTLDLGGTAQTQNGGLTLTGGTVQNGTLASTGTFDFRAGAVSAALAGAGAVVKATAGTVTFSGANTYAGTTMINGGTLALSGTGSIASSAVTNDSIFSIAGLTNGGTSIVSLAGTGSVVLGSNSLTLSNASGTFSGAISGTGGLTLTSGTETLSGTNGYTGATTVNGGVLDVEGTITGTSAVTVNAGGVLMGSGTIDPLAVTIRSGGTLAPGNGTPGTSTSIVGSLALQSGAIYLVHVNPATASYASVTDTATLGGATVNAVFAAGNYIEKKYTILSASGGISGTFAPTVVNTNLPTNFKTDLSYDANNAYLNLALAFVPPPNSGLNGNQQAVANALVNSFNANGGIPLVYGRMTAAGLTQASGESGTSSQQTTFNTMGQFVGLLTDPLAARSGAPGSASGAAGFAEEDQASAYAARKRTDAFAMVTKAQPQAFAQRWSVWAAGFGGAQSTDGNAVTGSNDTTSRVFGTAVGADYRFSADTLVVHHSDFDVLIPSHPRIGNFSGGKRISMLRATPGWRRMNPLRSRVRIIWWTDGGLTRKCRWMSASAGGCPNMYE